MQTLLNFNQHNNVNFTLVGTDKCKINLFLYYKDENLFKSKYEKYILKRAAVLFALIAVTDIIFLNNSVLVILGLLAGSGFGIIKFGMWAVLLSKVLLSPSNEAAVVKSLIAFYMLFGLTAALLFTSASINMSLFIGAAEGVLLIPVTLFMLSLIGGAGIKKNDLIK